MGPRTLSRLSGNFPDNPENIQTIWKFSKGSGNFPVQFQGLRAKTFRTRKNFPDGNATLPPRFLGLCSNLEQTVANTILSRLGINISNKFLVGIFTRQGHINQIY